MSEALIHIKRYDADRLILVGNEKIIHFTPTEYRILTPLLDGNVVSDTTLAHYAFQTQHIDQAIRENLDRHIDNIRVKIRSAGFNIYRVLKLGYVIQNLTEENETREEKDASVHNSSRTTRPF